MTDVADVPRDIDEILRRAEGGELPASTEIASSTHRVFRLTVDGRDLACKVYRARHGDELEREWYGLNLLHDAGSAVGPTPVARSDSAVVMSWLSGSTITRPSPALRDALHALYEIRLDPPTRTARSSPTSSRAATKSRLDRIGSGTPDVAFEWLDSAECEALCHVHLRNFVRGDGNLDNMLVADGHVRFVDFEDCGRGDWVCDLADLTEHVRSRAVDDREWIDFFESFDPDDVERARFRNMRRLEAIAWLALFLSRERQDEAVKQAERVAALLRER